MPPPQTADGISFLVIGDVSSGSISFDGGRYVSESYYSGLDSTRRPRRGDLLYTVTGSFGIAIPVEADRPFCVQRHIAILRPHRGIEPRYLRWALTANDLYEQAAKSATGTAQKTVGLRSLRGLTIRLAPTRLQAAVADTIELHTSRLERAASLLERARRNLARYRASVLKAAVEGRLVPTEAELARQEGREYEPASVLLQRILVERRQRWEQRELTRLRASGKTPTDDRWKARYVEPSPPDVSGLPTLPEGWCWTTVETVGDVLLGRQRAPQYLTGRFNHPYLRVANIKDDRIDIADVEQMDFDETHFRKYVLEPGDILVSEGQSPELVGQSAIYRGEIEGLCFQKTLHRFRPVVGGPSSEYAQLVFRSHVQNGVFKRLASITTNIAHLTLEKFTASPFPLPPQAEQQRIVERAAALLTDGEHMRADVRAQLARLTRLRQSILKWAFEGRLVDQDPSDEPAFALLDRIRADRASAAPVARPPRRPRST